MTLVGLIPRLVLVGALAYVPTLCATQVILDNSSFATLPSGGLPEDGCGTGCFYGFGQIPGWTYSEAGNMVGQFQPGTEDGNFSYFNYIPDGGITVADTVGPTLSQVVNTTVQVGVTYTMTVDIGTRNDKPSAGSADLLIDGVQYMASGTMAAAGDWSTFTVSYVGLAADIGDAITIQLNDPDPGAMASFSDVTFDPDPPSDVPEPKFMGSFGVALFCMFALYRRGSTSHRST
jgi:hypothetical protein